jgi:hypothetical protein
MDLAATKTEKMAQPKNIIKAVQSNRGLNKLGTAGGFKSLRSQGMLRHFKIE